MKNRSGLSLTHCIVLEEISEFLLKKRPLFVDVKKFLIETPINYESLILSDMKGVEISKALGNDKGVLPFTVLINPNGEVQNTFYGKLDITTLRSYLIDTIK